MSYIYNLREVILNKSTSFFETDMRYVLGGGFWMTLAQIIASFSAFLLAIAFAHFLPKEAYGNYKYVLAVSAVLSAFTLSGLSTSIVQSVARGFEGVTKNVFWLNLKWSLGMIIIALGISIYYLINGNFPLSLAMVLIAIFTPIINGSLLYRSILNGKKEFKATTLYASTSAIITSLFIFLGLLINTNFLFILLTYFLVNSIIGFSIHIYVAKNHHFNDKIDPNNLNYSKHLSLINILDTIVTNLDKILLFQYLGGSSLAIYSFATAVPEQIRNLLKIVPVLAIPKLSQKSKGDIHNVIYKKIFKLFLITIPIILIYFLIAPYIYKLAFPKYTEAIFYSQVFAIILLVEGGLPGSVFKAHSAIKEQYILNISSNTFKIFLLFILMFYYGIMGVILARIISRFFSFFLSLILLKRLK